MFKPGFTCGRRYVARSIEGGEEDILLCLRVLGLGMAPGNPGGRPRARVHTPNPLITLAQAEAERGGHGTNVACAVQDLEELDPVRLLVAARNFPSRAISSLKTIRSLQLPKVRVLQRPPEPASPAGRFLLMMSS